MFKLYDKSKTFLRMVGDYKDMCIESELSNGDKTLSFTTHGKQTEIQNEYYIETDDDWFVVKEVKPTSSGAEYVAKLNLEELEANMIPSFSAKNVAAAQAAQAAVQGTGWTVQSSLTKIRSVQQFKKTPYDLLMKIRDAFMCEIWFDTKSQIIHLEEQMGEDKGVYFRRELNLRSVNLSLDSYDYYTRIIPIGADGLRINNDGKDYVENYQYSNKIRTLIWEDSSYTDAEELKADAIKKLADLSKPIRSYSADVRDLARVSKQYSNLSFALGDTIHIVDEPNGIMDDQRIVKMRIFPDAPNSNTVELSNTVLTFDEMQRRLEAAASAWEDISNSDGSINGIYVHGIQVGDVVDIEVAINDGISSSETISDMQDAIDGTLTSVEVLYALSDSALDPPTSGWSTTAPAWEEGKYMWQKTTTNKADGTSVTSDPTCISGAAGEDGEDAILLIIDSSNGNVFKNNAVSTVLSVTVFKAGVQISTETALKATFGNAARIIWKYKGMGEDTWHTIISSDTRLSDGGMKFTLSPDDVDTKIVFTCELDF